MNSVLLLATLAVAIVAAAGAWRARIGQRTIIRKLDANRSIDDLSELVDMPGPELHVVEKDEGAPPPPPCPPPNGRTGRRLAVVSGATSLMVVALGAVVVVDEIPPRDGPLPASDTSLDQPAVGGTVTAPLSLAATPEQHDVPAPQQRPSTASTPLGRSTAPPRSPATTVTRTVAPTPPPPIVSTVVSAPAVTVVPVQAVPSTPVVGKHNEQVGNSK